MGDVDESTTPISMPLSSTKPAQKKKKKKRVPANYLAPTAASKAMKRDKSPLAGKTVNKQNSQANGPSSRFDNSPNNRFETSPNTRVMTISPQQPSTNFYRSDSQESTGLSSHWIEDLPIEQLKLFFPQFQQVFKEFIVLSELTTNILSSMGIFMKTEKPRKRSDRILELEEEGE